MNAMLTLLRCLITGHNLMRLPMTAADQRIVASGYNTYSPIFCTRCGRYSA